MTHLWHIHDTFMTHSWHIHDTFVTHSWHIHDTFMTHHDTFMTHHETFITHSWHNDTFMTHSWHDISDSERAIIRVLTDTHRHGNNKVTCIKYWDELNIFYNLILPLQFLFQHERETYKAYQNHQYDCHSNIVHFHRFHRIVLPSNFWVKVKLVPRAWINSLLSSSWLISCSQMKIRDKSRLEV